MKVFKHSELSNSDLVVVAIEHKLSEQKKEKKMTTKEINKIARIVGILYLAVAFLAPLGDMVFRAGLIVPGDAATTAINIMSSEGQYRLGFVSDLITQAVQIFLVLFIFRLLKPVNKNLAVLLLVLGLVGVPISMLNELNQIVPLLLLSGSDYLTVFNADQLQALATLFLDLRVHGVSILYIFWGLWLLPMGYLIIKSGYIPKILGALMIIAGTGYLIEFVLVFLFPQLDVSIKMFTFWGEVLLPLWLLIKGVNVEQWKNRTLESV